jgi:hypothetical protein
MTPREIHIAIDLGLQKLGSFAYDNIKPEYIDYAFNRMGDQYLMEKTTRALNPKESGFEDNITRLSTIRELVTESTLTVYNNTSRAQFSYLPHNYFSFIEAEGQVYSSCTDSAIVTQTVSSPTYYAVIPFNVTNFTTPPNPFLQTKIYKVTNTVPLEIFDFSDYAPNGLTDLEEIFTVKNKILTEINRRSDMKVYWESYNGLFFPNCLIFTSTDTVVGANAIRIDYTSVLTATSFFTTVAGTTINTATEPYNNKQAFCRLISNEEAYHLLAHPFGTTSPISPIITIFGDKVTIFINERFILKSLTFKYIRKPRRLNLPLNQSYEIQDPRALEKIIDMTVEYLAATIESQGYQALAIENQQRD